MHRPQKPASYFGAHSFPSRVMAKASFPVVALLVLAMVAVYAGQLSGGLESRAFHAGWSETGLVSSVAAGTDSNEPEAGNDVPLVDKRMSYQAFLQQEKSKFGDKFEPSDFPKDNIAKVNLIHEDPRTKERTVLIEGSGILVGHDRVLTSKHTFRAFLDFYSLNALIFNDEYLVPNRSPDNRGLLNEHYGRDSGEYRQVLARSSLENYNPDLESLKKVHPEIDLEYVKIEFLFGYENGRYDESRRRVAVEEMASSGAFQTRPKDASREIKNEDKFIYHHIFVYNGDQRFGDWTILKLDREIADIKPIAPILNYAGHYHKDFDFPHYAPKGAGIGYVSAGYSLDRDGGKSLSINSDFKFGHGGEDSVPASSGTFIKSDSVAAGGMSGGPLFARLLNPSTGRLEYHLVGISTGADNGQDIISSTGLKMRKGHIYFTNLTKPIIREAFAKNNAYVPD